MKTFLLLGNWLQRYNKRLIAMMHAKHLSSHINALQALSVNVPVQDLMLNHLMTTTLEETLQQWEQFTTNRMELPTTAVNYIPGGKVQDLGVNPEQSSSRATQSKSTTIS
jgi:hypothetical protein